MKSRQTHLAYIRAFRPQKNHFPYWQHWGLSRKGEVTVRVPHPPRTFTFPRLGTIHFLGTSTYTECSHTQCSQSPCLMGSVPTRRESDGLGGTHLRTHLTPRRLLTLSITRTSQDDEDWIEFCECPVNERGPNTTKS